MEKMKRGSRPLAGRLRQSQKINNQYATIWTLFPLCCAGVGTQMFKYEHHTSNTNKERKGARSCNKSAWTCPERMIQRKK